MTRWAVIVGDGCVLWTIRSEVMAHNCSPSYQLYKGKSVFAACVDISVDQHSKVPQGLLLVLNMYWT